jgi:GT2 family glycosyltransferase
MLMLSSKVYIIVINWRKANLTIECLEAILSLRNVAFRVIICDNGSDDRSLEQLTDWVAQQNARSASIRGGTDTFFPRDLQTVVDVRESLFTIVDVGENLGFAGGNNVGIRLALTDHAMTHVWLLNNDTIPEPDSLRILVEAMSSDSRMGICGSTLVYPDPSDTVQAFGFGHMNTWMMLAHHIGKFARLDRAGLGANTVVRSFPYYVVGASMLVSRKFIESVGLLSEDYFLYFEEPDWMRRAGNRFSFGWAPRSIVLHREGASAGAQSSTTFYGSFSDFYFLRACLLFCRRHFPRRFPIVATVVVARCILPICRGCTGRLRLLFSRNLWNSVGRRPDLSN